MNRLTDALCIALIVVTAPIADRIGLLWVDTVGPAGGYDDGETEDRGAL